MLASRLRRKSFTSKTDAETIGQVGQVRIHVFPVVAIDLAAPARMRFELRFVINDELGATFLQSVRRFLVIFQKPLGFSILRYLKLAI